MHLMQDAKDTYMQGVLAGTVAGGQRGTHNAHDATHCDNLPLLPLNNVIQDVFG